MLPHISGAWFPQNHRLLRFDRRPITSSKLSYRNLETYNYEGQVSQGRLGCGVSILLRFLVTPLFRDVAGARTIICVTLVFRRIDAGVPCPSLALLFLLVPNLGLP